MSIELIGCIANQPVLSLPSISQ